MVFTEWKNGIRSSPSPLLCKLGKIYIYRGGWRETETEREPLESNINQYYSTII
jgi:hypothetical protein